MADEPTLNCQACGAVVRKLTASEAQMVARNPYNYVVFCPGHRNLAIEEEFRG
jgi:hypothetical protein